MSLLSALLAAGTGTPGTMIEDVFAATAYVGDGSTSAVHCGVDLVDKGGMVWIMDRTTAQSPQVYDTIRGAGISMQSNSTALQAGPLGLTSFTSDGYTAGNNAATGKSGDKYIGYAFRKASKFFDVVQYIGDGTSGRKITHGLAIAPGLVVVKRYDNAGSWIAAHRSATGEMALESTAVAAASFTSVTATSAQDITIASSANLSGAYYVAYLWAHDTSNSGIIQCGSYAGNGLAAGPTVNLGWEPQFIMVKRSTGSSSDWFIFDASRSLPGAGPTGAREMRPNQTSSEGQYFGGATVNVSPTGFQIVLVDATINASGATYCYMAIRRGPMRTPTAGTQVFNVKSQGVSTTKITAGFPIDLVIEAQFPTPQSGEHAAVSSRLCGSGQFLQTDASAVEASNTGGASFDINDGFTQSSFFASSSFIAWMFRRAPNFLDVACWKSAGTTNQRVPFMGLGAVPELILTKTRDTTIKSWSVYYAAGGVNSLLILNNNAAVTTQAGAYGTTPPTASDFGIDSTALGTGTNMESILFASCPGVSKVGTYTGDGTSNSSHLITTGFSPRFFMVKRLDATGDWIVFDSVQGITTGNDSYLTLNTEASQVTSVDSVSPNAAGIFVNQNTTSFINVSGGNYLFLAIA